MTAQMNVSTISRQLPHREPNRQQEYISRSLSTATHAVNLLHGQGFNVEKLELGMGRPRIRIGFHYRCRVLGEPVVYSRGNSGLQYEKCVVQFEGCEVSWTQR